METSLVLPTKEVEQTNKHVMGLQESANALTIKSPDDMSVAADILGTIKQAENTITARKEEITRPLMRGLSSIRDLFKPMELTLDNAKKVVKAKVIAYQTVEEDRITKEKARIEKRVEKGTMRMDTAIEKFGTIGDVQKNAKGTSGKITMRTVMKMRVVDIESVPREYLIANMPMITEAVLKKKVAIPGVETYQEKIIAS
ncbi:MAG: hypothetical protein ACYDAK_13210 [Candidatus Limnocylindrales bacterium]